MKRASQRSRSATGKPKVGPDDEFLRIARARFKLIQDNDKPQIENELEAIRFYNGDQWPGEIKRAREGMAARNGMPEIPARPMITINKAREPVRQVLNQERQSDLGVTIVPADDFAGLAEPIEDKEVELREGLVRGIQRTSQAAAARTWAFERATISGSGKYGVMVRFGDGKTRDKEVYVRRFYDQSAVSLGPHDEPDGSDAEYGFVASWLSWDDYVAHYPDAADGKNKLVARIGDDNDFKALGEEYPGWFTFEGGKKDKDKIRRARVVEYWYIERTSREVTFLSDGRDVWTKDLTAEDQALLNDPETGEPIGTRMVVEKQVKFAKIDGAQVLERTDWEGKYIPIIKVLGEELQPVDGKRLSEGMVGPGIEAGRGFNVLVSKLVETIGHAPLQPLILDPESIEDWLEWYKLAAVRPFPYLPQRSRDDQGREYREAHRPDADPNLQPMAMAIGMFDQFIQSTMGVHDPSTGKVDPRLKSGKAIESVIAQDAHGTSNFIDNLARSIHYEALIINDLLFPVYGRPGRIAKLLNRQNESQTVMLHQPFTMQSGRPVAAPEDPTAKTYTLTKDAMFNVAVKVTKNFDLKREQTAAFLGELVGANPAFMSQYGDIFFRSIDVPDHQEMADRAKIMLDPRILAAMDAKKQGLDIPPSLQAHIGQLQQQLQQLEQAAAQQQKIIDTDQVKANADLEKAKLNAENAVRIKQMDLDARHTEAEADRAAKIESARITAAKQSADLALEAQEEAIALRTQQTHESGLAAADAQHAHELSDQEHQQILEQQAQQAALTPEPAAPQGAA